jgi:hypothetical protein
MAGPVVTLALYARASLPSRDARLRAWRPGVYERRNWAGRRTGLGLLALPFHKAAFATAAVGPLGGVVHVLSRALVDEVLLRLFLVTGVVWMLVRWYATPSPRAAVVAVTAAALVQAVLYLPGATAIGFASATTTAGYLAVTVMLPAVVFGLLYWKRGFATALLAHATALLALMLMI